jgi:hypothetical protein
MGGLETYLSVAGCDDDDNKPVWPTGGVGALLFGGVRRAHINHVCFHIP